VRCHDFHLRGYEVREFGAEIILHLVDDYPPRPAEESHIRFAGVELYHFVHSGGTIIFGIDEVSLSQILHQHWENILHWATGRGGVPHWDRDDRASYQTKLATDDYKAWEISSSIGFEGFVIAKSIEDVTDQFTQTA
jgi:hypothetical protein